MPKHVASAATRCVVRLYNTNQLHDDAPADGQPRVHLLVVVDEKLVRTAPYADDDGGRDEHVQEHIEHGQRAVRPRWTDRGESVGRRRRRTRVDRKVAAGSGGGGRHKSTAAVIVDLVGRIIIINVGAMRLRRRRAPPPPGLRLLAFFLYFLLSYLREVVVAAPTTAVPIVPSSGPTQL